MLVDSVVIVWGLSEEKTMFTTLELIEHAEKYTRLVPVKPEIAACMAI